MLKRNWSAFVVLSMLFVLVGFTACTDTEELNEVNTDAIAGASDSLEQTDQDKIDKINQSIRLDVNNPKLYAERAKLLMTFVERGEFSPTHVQLAINDWKRAIAIDSTNVDYHFELGEVYYKMNVPNEALTEYAKVIALDRDYSEAHLQSGRIFFVFEEHQLAMNSFDEVVRIDKFMAEPYYMKGLVFLETGDTVKAVSSFETAREVDPSYYEPSFKMGQLYALANDEQALEYYDAAIKARPYDIEAIYAKAYYNQKHDSIADAMTDYHKILTIDSTDVDTYHNMGYVFLVYVQDFDSAIYYFNDALEIDSAHVASLSNLGLAYEMKESYPNAVTYYKKALMIDPSFDAAAKGLDRMDRVNR